MLRFVLKRRGYRTQILRKLFNITVLTSIGYNTLSDELFIKTEQNLDEVSEKELRCIRIEGTRVPSNFAELIDNTRKGFK